MCCRRTGQGHRKPACQPEAASVLRRKKWVLDIDSWDVCNGLSGKLVDKTLFTFNKATEWSLREEEFVNRVDFSIDSDLAVHDKKASDQEFEPFLRRISLWLNFPPKDLYLLQLT